MTVGEAEQFISRGTLLAFDPESHISADDRKARLNQFQKDMAFRIRNAIRGTRRVDLAILQCHIVMEFLLDQFIDLMAPVEGALAGERFTFKQKEAIAFMVSGGSKSLFFPTADLLNQLRNKVAHTLAVDRQLLQKLFHIHGLPRGEFKRMSDRRIATGLGSITAGVCGEMTGFVAGVHWTQFIEDERNRKIPAASALPKQRAE